MDRVGRQRHRPRHHHDEDLQDTGDRETDQAELDRTDTIGAGLERIVDRVRGISGAKASRPKLDLVLTVLRDGDTLKVTRLDRLSRSVLHLVTLGAELRGRSIGLHVIEQGIDTDTMEGRAMFGMLSVLAGLAQQPYDARDKTVQEIADLFDVPRSTVYGHLTNSEPRQSRKTTIVAQP